MKNTRAGLLFGFGALASVAFFTAHSDAKPETMTKIADGVWFREGDLKNLGHCKRLRGWRLIGFGGICIQV